MFSVSIFTNIKYLFHNINYSTEYNNQISIYTFKYLKFNKSNFSNNAVTSYTNKYLNNLILQLVYKIFNVYKITEPYKVKNGNQMKSLIMFDGYNMHDNE